MKTTGEILQNGLINVTGRLIDASNATLLAECSYENEKVKCIYKPIAGERPLWDFQDGNLAQREYASYLISEASNLQVVPLTLLREGPFGLGMVQEWIEIDSTIDLATFFSTNDPRLRKMALFDAVVNNTDRKIGHLLPQSDGRLFGCDHGVTFHQEYKLRTVLWQWAGEALSIEEKQILHDLLLQIERNDIEELQLLITQIEIEALIERIRDLLAAEAFPMPSQDWPAIPWPAF
jgi:uncharacterized repeat protein (TIGR03843 family)